ncbi:MAG: RiPP maturation radical SAM C-methyltransferase [Proteobacteria bacterium]|nr:RiPP maturation radical SAM C-methyltransferase [Pseudomonadota bacterium]
MTGCDICFVVPAFSSVQHTPIGVSVLTAACRAKGLRVATVYANLMLAARVGYEVYEEISAVLPTKQTGEYIFKPHAYPPDVLARIPAGVDAPRKAELTAAVAPAIDGHLDEAAAAVAATRPRIVALTSTFQQNLGAIAVARRVRATLPEVLIVLGGGNVAGVMADGLARTFDCVDHFFDGEGDVVFPVFCADYLRDGTRPPSRVVPCEPVADLAAVPLQDDSDFAAALAVYQADGRLPASLPHYADYESSRGCWWGAKHHCTFCGLNGQGMTFREKTADRVVEEIDTVARQWPDRLIRTTDNIMPTSFFDGVLPRLAAREKRPALFYEVKANLKDEQIAAMRRAGIVSIQPGIEALSTPVLKLMRKGVSAQQNIMLLRMCAKHGMHVGWNLIYGFPGEELQHYRDVLALLPSLTHLRPPDGFSRIMLDRFSPYHSDPGQFGISGVHAFESYRGLYPQDAPLDDIAYHFRGRYTTPLLDDTDFLAEFSGAVKRWQSLWRKRGAEPRLELVQTEGGRTVVSDSRGPKPAIAMLSRGAVDALAFFERPRRPGEVPEAVAGHLDELLARRFVVDHEGLLLSLVVREAVVSRVFESA